jgi:hypothetical protein
MFDGGAVADRAVTINHAIRMFRLLRQCNVETSRSAAPSRYCLPLVVTELHFACMSVETHFAKVDQNVRATCRRLMAAARALGEVTEESKKTSIHLVRQTAFAGVAIRRSSLILTIKSASDIRHPRIAKREQTSANRWHLEVRLEEPAHVDRQLAGWLRAAYELAGPKHRD